MGWLVLLGTKISYAFPGLALVSYEEGWLEDGRHEARLVARREAAR
jgi:hypothetical protein